MGQRPAIAGLTADPDFASVVLLLDFAGDDGDTNITDLSNSGHVETFIAPAQVDTAIQQYTDTNSLLCSGSSGFLRYLDDADWDFGAADFTVEIGAYFETPASGSKVMISNFNATGPSGWGIQTAAGPVLNFIADGVQVKSETWSPSDQTWYHVAISRSGTNLRMFIDGVQLSTPTTNSSDMSGANQPLVVGVLRSSSPTQYFLGNLSAVRITKGVARYTANFTPPTEFYPMS